MYRVPVAENKRNHDFNILGRILSFFAIVLYTEGVETLIKIRGFRFSRKYIVPKYLQYLHQQSQQESSTVKLLQVTFLLCA